MSLAELIHKKRSVEVATAIRAIPATHALEWAGTVATIATVAVAKPKEAKDEGGNGSRNSSSKPREQQTASYRWHLHFADRNPMVAALSPPATHAEVLASFPSALAAEPIEARRRQPATMLTGKQETAVVAWLVQIGESDEAIIDEVLTRCRMDEVARVYYLGRVDEILRLNRLFER